MNSAPRAQPDNKDLYFILLIFFLALLFRMLYLRDFFKSSLYPFLPFSDSDAYFCWAKDIAGGQLIGRQAAMKWPLYAYLLAFLFKAFNANLSFIYSLQFILGAVNCVLVYLIARIIFGRSSALFAGIFCSLYGLFIFYEGLLVYTSLSLFLNSLFFLWLLNNQWLLGRKNIFFLGLLLGVCAITQANTLAFGVPAALWALSRARPQFRQYSLNFGIFILGLGIVAGSVTLLNYLAEKDLVLIAGNTGFNFYSGNHPEANGTFYCPRGITPNQEDMFRDSRVIARAASNRPLKTSEVSRFWFERARENIWQDPFRHLKLFGKKIVLLFSPAEPVHDVEFSLIKDEAGIFKAMWMDLRFILPLAFLGMLLAARHFKQAFLLYLGVAVFSLSIALFFVSARYRAALVPLLAVFAGFAASSLAGAWQAKSYRKFGLLAAALAAIFLLLNSGGRERAAVDPRDVVEYHLTRAAVFEGNADYPLALKHLRAAYVIAPDNYRVLIRSGVINYRLHNLKEAEERFRQVIRACPLCVDAYYNLGFIYNQEERFSEAKPLLEHAVSLDPDNIGAHFELAMVYKAEKNYARAKEELNFVLARLSRWRLQDRRAAEEELRGLGQ